MTVAVRTERGEGPASDAVRGTYGLEDPARLLAMAAGALLTASYVSILYHVTTVVSGTRTLLAVVAVALVLATTLARALRPRHAVALGATLLTLGFVGYMEAVPYGWLLLSNLGQTTTDILALLTGLSVLRMTEAGVWAIGVAPAPVFLSWYLFVRQRYAAGAAVGGAALGVFVLTGDADTVVTLAGVAGAAATVGLGEIERRDGTVEQVDSLAVLVAVMVLVGTSVTVVPTGASETVLPDHQDPALETGLMTDDERMSIVGSIRLSPEVRFVVESNEPAYWRTGAYDRYTGQGWVRSGQSRSAGQLPRPPGDYERIEQRYTAKSGVGVMPAAWRPVDVSGGVASRAQASSLGGLSPDRALQPGDSYAVTSARPLASAERLQRAGTDYPGEIEQQYTQLPASTPDRVTEFTDEVTAGASTPYEKAVHIEQWLERNKEYSLDVERPTGSIADSFLFEMEAGYCTYYATTMVTMLRSQGVPARFVVGYTSGQRVAEDQWVVRGLDSHAWVEVYFPDVGWVKFDPTPGGPRQAAEQERVETARDNGREDVDAAGSEDGTWTPTPDPTTDERPGNDTGNSTADPEYPGSGNRSALEASTPAFITPYASDADGDDGIPSRELLGLGTVLAIGLVAAIRRSGVAGRAYQTARIRWQGTRGEPDQDVERAFQRLEYLLARQHRERRPGETRRAYLQALAPHLDERARRVGELYHRARYGGGVSRQEADQAVGLVDELVRERTPLLGRFGAQ